MEYLILDTVSDAKFEQNNTLKQQISILKQAGSDFKVLTRDYNRYQAKHLKELGIAEDKVVNMFDFFQNAVNIPHAQPTIHDLPQIPAEAYEIQPHGSNFNELRDGGKLLAHQQVMPETFGQVDYIRYYDQYGNYSTIEYYDVRGFKTMEQYFHPNGQVAYEFWYKPSGERVVEAIYMFGPDKKEVINTSWHVNDFKGASYELDNIDQLFSLFLNEQIAGDDQARLINDTPDSIHLLSSDLIGNPEIYLKLSQVNDRDAIKKYLEITPAAKLLVDTDDQAAIIEPLGAPVFVAPEYGLTNTELLRSYADITKRLPENVIAFTDLRSSEEINTLINAWRIVHEANDTATLTIVGSPIGATNLTPIFNKLKELDLFELVSIQLDAKKVPEVYDRSTLMLLPSTMYGTTSNVAEAALRSIPTIVVDDNELAAWVASIGAGSTVEKDAVNLADAIINLVKNPETLIKASQAAHSATNQLSLENSVAKWEAVLNN